MEKKTYKFRASYTILSAWRGGRWQDAINMYFKIEARTNQRMEDGKAMHQAWEEETKATRCLPQVFGGGALQNPVPELKIEVDVYDWLQLVGVIDCYDEPDVHEHKSGILNSMSYARDKQIGMYAVLCLLSGRKVKRLFIHHHNQYTKESDMSIVWVTPKLIEDTMEWIESTAREMHEYFLANDLYERFGKYKEAAKAKEEDVLRIEDINIGD